MDKPVDIIDRDNEWETLERFYRSRRSELIMTVGRRPVGKSFLFFRFARAHGGVYYQATRRTEPEQLSSLSRVVGEHFQDPALLHGSGFPDWEHLFSYISEKGKGKTLLILDEFTYLVDAAPALPSILQQVWDHDWQQKRMMILLSGSCISAMSALEGGDQPLFGRGTGRLVLNPFIASDIVGFAPSYSPSDIIRAYGLFGNLPGNLALIDRDESLSINVQHHLLDPAGRLIDDAQVMLDSFLGDAGVHYSILNAIAQGEETWSGITRRVKRTGGGLLRPLQWLEKMGLIERIVPITEKDPSRSRRVLYRIADPYLLFWHRCIAPLVRSGSIGLAQPAHLWSEVIAPRLDDYMGPIFEMVCRDAVRQGGFVPFVPVRVGQWWEHGEGEVDVVALGGAGELFVGECTWGEVNTSHLAPLRKRAARIADQIGSVSSIHLGLFSGREGKIRGVKGEKGEHLILITSDQLING